jgi:cadmium resistance protein CadD (predicted permease)
VIERQQEETLMSPPTTARSMQTVRQRSSTARLNVVALVVASAAMLLQIAAGSTLYPSVTGPIVLVATALAVAFVPGRWVAYMGLAVPLVLGVGAIVAAAMTGDFIDQLTDLGNPGLVLGSLLHVVGLTAAVAGGIGLVLGQRAATAHGR